jgi:outer membrane protein TolC
MLAMSGLVAVGAVAQGPGQLEVAENAAAAGTVALTTEEAVALALSSSRQLQSLDTKVEIQQYRLSGGWIDNPELRVRNLSTRGVDEEFDELEIGIRWRPPALGEAAEQRQEGQVLLWEQKVEAHRARDWVASRVRRACADVIMYRELLGIASDRVDNESRRITQIKSMVDLGRRSIVYYTKAKMMVSDARNEHTRRLQALRKEERRLQRLTGVASAIDVIFEPLPQVKVPRETLLSIAYAHRPEVQLVEARQQLAIKRHDRERRRRWPQLSFVEVSRHHEQGAGDRNEITFGVEIPLFDRNGGRAKATQLGIARKEAQSLAIRERIEDEVHDTFAAYDEARLAWQLAQADGQLIIEDASRVIAEASAHGVVPADEVLELERAILDTRATLARRRRELAHAVCFLYYALGIDGPEQAATPWAR